MKLRTGILGWSLFCLTCLAMGTETPSRPGWKLMFEDTFDQKVLDENKWIAAYRPGRADYYRQIGKGTGFDGSPAHYVVEDGILKLRLSEELPKRPSIHAAAVSSIQTSQYRYDEKTQTFSTDDRFVQKYGMFEIRCRMPRGSGLHSAFWLLQKDADKQEITVDGKRKQIGDGVVEIDIFEMLGKDVDAKVNLFNVHFTRNGHFRYSVPFDVSQEFHVWGLEWEEGKLTWYLDGEPIRVYEGETPQQEMFVLLGLYQGCGWTGTMQEDMPYPRDFEIDFIRVWQKE